MWCLFMIDCCNHLIFWTLNKSSDVMSEKMTGVPNRDTPLKVVICGGGIVGCSTAYYLKHLDPSVDVTVVDSVGPASQASGKAGGFLALGWNSTSQCEALTSLSYSLHQKLRSELEAEVGYRDLTTLSINIGNTQGVQEDGWIANRGQADELGTARNTSQVHPKLLTQALLGDAQVA